MPIGSPGTSVGPGLVDLAGLKTFAKNFVKTDGLSAEDKTKFGTVNAKGLTREQVMLKGGLTGIEGLNIDFNTKDGLAIWNSIAGADGLMSAREHTQALLRFDTGKEADVAGSDTKFNLSKAEATAGFQKLLADAMYLAKLAKMRCYNCGEKGHTSKNCPNAKSDEEDEPEEDEPPLAGLTLACCATVSKEPETRLFEFYEVCLDSGSQVNIVDPRLLNNLRTLTKT